MYRFNEEDDEPQEPAEQPQENNDQPEKSASPFDRLMKTRTITIFGEINMKKAQDVTQQLLLLAADSDEPIKVFINSPGGHVESGDTIFDMIRFIKPKVKVIGTGWVASAGALIYAAADKEDRYSLPNTRFLLHQPAGGAMGQASDIAIEATEIIKMRRRLNQIFADQTGQPLAKVEKDTDRNFWMSAKEAQEYGLVGKIIQSAAELE
ncbi:MAG: ATP-dependent Clp protease proteolytic subunit [Chloroflexi bacterium]|nr:ATP-dependent Clp protease proteolytic subunit [Ardenticatenaceae bacterium]MBL1127778.1 ATP-dependent Clp protease proteolytic subunit [Chloroflexota bacterium]NOG33846.1 ATP-dependent Clp protease proteolytic subunit [Chloroflexota bacterium]GIK54823.1 MAG: ATP-dependent Clp protease proteolytic subunit [Chloroflexota bacterium]